MRTPWPSTRSVVVALWLALTLAAAGCAGGQTGTPTSDRSDGGCDEPDPRAATASSGEPALLWQAFEGEYVLHGNWRSADAPDEARATTLYMQIARSSAALTPSEPCEELAVPVRVALTSDDGLLDLTVTTTLHGLPERGLVALECAAEGTTCREGEVLTRTLSGSITLSAERVDVRLKMSGGGGARGRLEAELIRDDGGTP